LAAIFRVAYWQQATPKRLIDTQALPIHRRHGYPGSDEGIGNLLGSCDAPTTPIRHCFWCHKKPVEHNLCESFVVTHLQPHWHKPMRTAWLQSGAGMVGCPGAVVGVKPP